MRDAFADVLRGLHIREEVEDFAAKDRFPRSPVGTTRSKQVPGTGPERTMMATRSTPHSDIRSPTPTDVVDLSSATGSGVEDQGYVLIDADGVLIEVTGIAALRTEFERLLFDKHLTANQVTGVWESNAAARDILQATWGEMPLSQLEDHVMSLHNAVEIERMPVEAISSVQASGATADLKVDIDPTWGIQKTFYRYREALEHYSLKTCATTAEITRFRQANEAIELRLQASLPERTAQLSERYPTGDTAGQLSLLPSPRLPGDAQRVGSANGSIT
jgi:hypothetical protein